jgi:hypothetical protein
MKHSILREPERRHLSLFLLCLALLTTWGCASRRFLISSDPEGAYIVGYGETTQDKPVNETLIFLGKSEVYNLVAMKRGYYPDTITLSKESPTSVQFVLRPVEGIPPLIRRPVELSLQNTNLLPVNVQMILHKGVGNLDKYEESEELSHKTCSELNQKLCALQSDSTISLISIPDTSGWQRASAELKAYLQSLSTDLLAYYPEAPSVAPILKLNSELFSPVLDRLDQTGEEEFLVYAWCKSIKPTSGRVIGNIGVMAASAAVSGYEAATYGYPVSYSDPSVFAMDNSTLFVAYIIDPGSGEVLGSRQYVVSYDIAKPERLEAWAKSIIYFPLVELNQEP